MKGTLQMFDIPGKTSKYLRISKKLKSLIHLVAQLKHKFIPALKSFARISITHLVKYVK